MLLPFGVMHQFVLRSLIVLSLLAIPCSSIQAQRRKPTKKPPQPKLPDLKSPEDKLRFLEMIRASFPTIRSRNVTFQPQDLDESLERYVSRASSEPFAEVIDDEKFIRRVYIDATGKFPPAGRITKFINDKDPDKRSKLVDELVETDAFARKNARYWRSVVFYESNAPKNQTNPQAFEDWLFREFKQGTSWDRIVGEMVSAVPQRRPKVKVQDNGWNQDYGPNNYVLACERKPEVIASNTARLFMGISIGCAECHDHPFDDWKREQFHELAAFFAPGKYHMTDQYDPTQKTEMQAKFLLGEEPPPYLKPDQRRVAGAAYLIYNPDNYWFARAYVNRVWNEYLGDGFYSVDSLGPDKEVIHQLVVNRLSAAFRFAGFDTKWLAKLIMKTRVYQREIRTIQDTEDLFTAVRPSRLRPAEVADNVQQLVGENKNLERAIKGAFDQNPSVPQADLEGSIQQALLLMNNGTLQGRLAASELRKRLSEIKDDRQLIQQAFLNTIARRPTEQEITRYQQFIKGSANRYEGIVDMLWVLVNSAEFVTKT